MAALYCVHFVKYDVKDREVFGLFKNDKLIVESNNRKQLVELIQKLKGVTK